MRFVFAASPVWILGPLVIAASAVAYLLFRLVSSLRSRFGKPLGPQPRGAMAGLSLVCGPLIGFLLSLIHLQFADVNPLDVTDTMVRYTSVGLVLGLFLAATFGLSDFLVRTFVRRGKQAMRHGRDLE